MANFLRVRHFGIVTEDMGRSLVFYRDYLGFTTVLDQEEHSPFIEQILGLKGSRLHTVKLTGPDGTTIELLDFRLPSHAPQDWPSFRPGPTHLAIQVTSLAAFYTSMRERGIPFISPPTPSPDGKAFVAFCRAPEGSYIEAVEILDEKKP